MCCDCLWGWILKLDPAIGGACSVVASGVGFQSGGACGVVVSVAEL